MKFILKVFEKGLSPIMHFHFMVVFRIEIVIKIIQYLLINF